MKREVGRKFDGNMACFLWHDFSTPLILLNSDHNIKLTELSPTGLDAHQTGISQPRHVLSSRKTALVAQRRPHNIKCKGLCGGQTTQTINGLVTVLNLADSGYFTHDR